MGKGRGITVCPNDDGTVTVKQSGSEVEMDYTPEMVEDSEAFFAQREELHAGHVPARQAEHRHRLLQPVTALNGTRGDWS